MTFQQHTIGFQPASADFPAPRVHHYRHRTIHFLRCLTHSLQGCGMRFDIAMRHIQARNIHACANHRLERINVITCRTDGGNDLRFS